MRIIRIILLLIILQSCFPSFAPKEEIKKEIQKGEQKDTICKSHNIANLRMKKHTIIIGFYGTPKRYTKPITIPKKILDYKIEIDTTFVKN